MTLVPGIAESISIASKDGQTQFRHRKKFMLPGRLCINKAEMRQKLSSSVSGHLVKMFDLVLSLVPKVWIFACKMDVNMQKIGSFRTHGNS